MMTILRRMLHRPGPPPADPEHEAFVARMEEGRALGLRATRDARHNIRRINREHPRLQRDAGLDNDSINAAAFGRPRPSQQGKGPR